MSGIKLRNMAERFKCREVTIFNILNVTGICRCVWFVLAYSYITVGTHCQEELDRQKGKQINRQSIMQAYKLGD